ncbi:oligosaccharide flippase family protein [Desulfuromonas acetoxidans]|uniref:oligosaccharide flippase family protein n=1 Tax=Desulfuromonas acetoxidans TaxID=891 RepID=UPI00292E3273|nr:oligosaccharide flippase family protein [Desulfuromonas acetoxidans]
MPSRRKFLRNLAINWGGHIASLVVMFFLSPYVVGKLDAVSYGIWSLLTVLIGYMGIFDIGVRSSVGRHIALFLGKKDQTGVDETIRAGFAIFTLTGGLILLVGVVLGWCFPIFFRNVPAEYYDTVRLLLPFMAVNLWFSAVAAIYSNVLTAHDRFDVARSIDLCVLLIRTAATVYALYSGWALWGLAGALALANFSSLVFNRIGAGRIYPALRSFPLLFSRSRFKELFGYGFYAFISNVAFKVIGQSDLVIVGAFLSVASVREYSVGAMLIYYSAPFISMIGMTYFPSVQKKVAAQDFCEVKKLLNSQIRISLSFGLLVYLGLVFYAQPFIRLWMLQDGFDLHSVTMAASVMAVLALSKIPTLYLLPCINVLSAMGHVRFTAKRAVVEAVMNVVFSLLFVMLFNIGLVGVAAGTLTARLLISAVAVPYYLCRKLDTPLAGFVYGNLLPGAFAAVLFSLYCLLLQNLWPIEGWLSFWEHVGSAILFWCLILLTILLPHEDRTRLLKKVKKTVSIKDAV